MSFLGKLFAGLFTAKAGSSIAFGGSTGVEEAQQLQQNLFEQDSIQQNMPLKEEAFVIPEEPFSPASCGLNDDMGFNHVSEDINNSLSQSDFMSDQMSGFSIQEEVMSSGFEDITGQMTESGMIEMNLCDVYGADNSDACTNGFVNGFDEQFHTGGVDSFMHEDPFTTHDVFGQHDMFDDPFGGTSDNLFGDSGTTDLFGAGCFDSGCSFDSGFDNSCDSGFDSFDCGCNDMF